MAKVKKKEHENLSNANVEKVIQLLEAEKPITKKQACEILNITYNTTRLGKIIEEYKEQKVLDEKRRAANKGKPASDHEIKYAIEQYLEGISVSEIADQLYRPSSFVRTLLDRIGVPSRGVGENYANFSALPEQCISDKFEVGEIAWSSRYSGPCIIERERGTSADGLSRVYQIYVVEPYEEPEEKFFATVGKAGFYANQPAYDLGKLDHLKQYGVDISRKI